MRTITIPFEPHSQQVQIWSSAARFLDVVCGRRFGKTRLLAGLAIRSLFVSFLGVPWPMGYVPRAWLLAPTYKVADEDWSMPGGVLDIGKAIFQDVSKSERRAVAINGGILEVRTGDDEKNVRGGGLDFLGIDECGQIKRDIWLAVRPTVSDRKGRIARVGTPRGRNWWYREYLKGCPSTDKLQDHEAFSRKSIDSPYFPKEEWEIAKRDLPLDWFRQEYEAEFLESQAAVFKGLDAVLRGGAGEDPRPGGRYVHGLDIAKTQDWSVLTTINIDTGRIVSIKRMQRVEYQHQADTFAAIANRYGGPIWADATGVGPALTEPLRVRGLQVHDYTFTEESKRQLVGNLIVGIESRGINIPTEGDFAVLVSELRDFEYKLSGTGQPRYGAPEGLHDDCVISLALAYWGLQRGGAGFVREHAALGGGR